MGPETIKLHIHCMRQYARDSTWHRSRGFIASCEHEQLNVKNWKLFKLSLTFHGEKFNSPPYCFVGSLVRLFPQIYFIIAVLGLNRAPVGSGFIAKPDFSPVNHDMHNMVYYVDVLVPAVNSYFLKNSIGFRTCLKKWFRSQSYLLFASIKDKTKHPLCQHFSSCTLLALLCFTYRGAQKVMLKKIKRNCSSNQHHQVSTC